MSETRGTTASPGRRSSTERLSIAKRLGLWWRQIVAELRKVIWPTRLELITYSIVSFAFVAVMIAIMAGLDLGFTKAVLAVFG